MIQQSKIINKNLYRNKIINDFHKLIDINNSIIRGIINLVNQNYFSFISNSFLASEEKSKELYLLNRKREPEYFIQKIGHDNIFQKEKTFPIINNSKLENINQIYESRNIINELESNPINYGANNFKKLLNESSNNLKQEENNKPNFIIDDKERNLKINSSRINNPSTKVKYFNIEKNINAKSLLNFDTSNEIKVLKNRKIVYINTDLLNDYSTSKYIKKLKRINFVKRSKTSSKYRGVSRNGSNWQVLIMINNKKYYIGSYPSKELAARIYDIHAIKKRGIKARTNFPYNNIQIKNIYEKNIDIKCDKVSEIMKQISN